jgi:hypothetical protein
VFDDGDDRFFFFKSNILNLNNLVAELY